MNPHVLAGKGRGSIRHGKASNGLLDSNVFLLQQHKKRCMYPSQTVQTAVTVWFHWQFLPTTAQQSGILFKFCHTEWISINNTTHTIRVSTQIQYTSVYLLCRYPSWLWESICASLFGVGASEIGKGCVKMWKMWVMNKMQRCIIVFQMYNNWCTLTHCLGSRGVSYNWYNVGA